MPKYHLSARSANAKTGPIAVTTSPQCPNACPLRGICYAESGHLSMHWHKVRDGIRGDAFHKHLQTLVDSPAPAVRLNQAGDLPTADGGESIDKPKAKQLLAAAAFGDRPAWTYTHYAEPRTIAELNQETGATVNYSADNLEAADKAHAMGLPVVAITEKHNAADTTPAGKKLVTCPAQLSNKITCKTCGNGSPLCSRKGRSYIVRFIAHGRDAKKVLKAII